MQELEARLEKAVTDALARYQSGMQETFPNAVSALIRDTECFGAKASINQDAFIVEVNTASIHEIDRLWSTAWQSTILIDNAGQRVKDVDGAELTLERLQHLSLTWLVLHELMHIRLGHLDLLGVAQLVEIEGQDNDQITENPLSKELRQALSEDERKRFRPCLELQADNEATEIMFGQYAESEWGRFRIEAAAIFVVMALMEKANVTTKDGNRTYPLVATRFFTLFAQLFQYWLYPGADLRAGDGESFVSTPRKPDGDEFHRYMKYVLALTVNDVVQIALWAEAKNFLIDLGEGSALFKDIFEIQYAQNLAVADLKTSAAQEWRDLMPVNEKIMAISGLRG